MRRKGKDEWGNKFTSLDLNDSEEKLARRVAEVEQNRSFADFVSKNGRAAVEYLRNLKEGNLEAIAKGTKDAFRDVRKRALAPALGFLLVLGNAVKGEAQNKQVANSGGKADIEPIKEDIGKKVKQFAAGVKDKVGKFEGWIPYWDHDFVNHPIRSIFLPQFGWKSTHTKEGSPQSQSPREWARQFDADPAAVGGVSVEDLKEDYRQIIENFNSKFETIFNNYFLASKELHDADSDNTAKPGGTRQTGAPTVIGFSSDEPREAGSIGREDIDNKNLDYMRALSGALQLQDAYEALGAKHFLEAFTAVNAEAKQYFTDERIKQIATEQGIEETKIRSALKHIELKSQEILLAGDQLQAMVDALPAFGITPDSGDPNPAIIAMIKQVNRLDNNDPRLSDPSFVDTVKKVQDILQQSRKVQITIPYESQESHTSDIAIPLFLLLPLLFPQVRRMLRRAMPCRESIKNAVTRKSLTTLNFDPVPPVGARRDEPTRGIPENPPAILSHDDGGQRRVKPGGNGESDPGSGTDHKDRFADILALEPNGEVEKPAKELTQEEIEALRVRYEVLNKDILAFWNKPKHGLDYRKMVTETAAGIRAGRLNQEGGEAAMVAELASNILDKWKEHDRKEREARLKRWEQAASNRDAYEIIHRQLEQPDANEVDYRGLLDEILKRDSSADVETGTGQMHLFKNAKFFTQELILNAWDEKDRREMLAGGMSHDEVDKQLKERRGRADHLPAIDRFADALVELAEKFKQEATGLENKGQFLTRLAEEAVRKPSLEQDGWDEQNMDQGLDHKENPAQKPWGEAHAQELYEMAYELNLLPEEKRTEEAADEIFDHHQAMVSKTYFEAVFPIEEKAKADTTAAAPPEAGTGTTQLKPETKAETNGFVKDWEELHRLLQAWRQLEGGDEDFFRLIIEQCGKWQDSDDIKKGLAAAGLNGDTQFVEPLEQALKKAREDERSDAEIASLARVLFALNEDRARAREWQKNSSVESRIVVEPGQNVCPACKSQNSIGARFCGNCGKPFDAVAPVVSKGTEAPVKGGAESAPDWLNEARNIIRPVVPKAKNLLAKLKQAKDDQLDAWAKNDLTVFINDRDVQQLHTSDGFIRKMSVNSDKYSQGGQAELFSEIIHLDYAVYLLSFFHTIGLSPDNRKDVTASIQDLINKLEKILGEGPKGDEESDSPPPPPPPAPHPDSVYYNIANIQRGEGENVNAAEVKKRILSAQGRQQVEVQSDTQEQVRQKLDGFQRQTQRPTRTQGGRAGSTTGERRGASQSAKPVKQQPSIFSRATDAAGGVAADLWNALYKAFGEVAGRRPEKPAEKPARRNATGQRTGKHQQEAKL